MLVCGCARDALCDRCLGAELAQLGGVAGARGWHWAERVWQVTRRRDAWTIDALKARTRALQLVTDLTRDRRLREALALVGCVIAEAAHRWAMLLAPAGTRLKPYA